MTTIAVLADTITSYDLPDLLEPQRAPVTRHGERTPIPSYIRSLIYRRDGGVCALCGGLCHMAHSALDHIWPWSAGGLDRADNLRLTHQWCNETRSNFVSWWDVPRMRVTWLCRTCDIQRNCRRAGQDEWDDVDYDLEVAPLNGQLVRMWCGYCELSSWAVPLPGE